MRKQTFVFLILGCVFVSNVLLAEFIGVKIFSLEASLGFEPLQYRLFGIPLSLSYTCGVIIWPIVFILSDIINDYYGRHGVKLLTYIAVAITIYAFIISNIAIHSTPASWWQGMAKNDGIQDYNQAFRVIFGQGNNIIVGSLVAFIIGQFTDVFIFNKIKHRFGSKQLWIRATASTLVSQLIDSFVVIYIAFYIGQGWPLNQVLGVAFNNYIYKGVIAVILIPVLHAIHKGLEHYFGRDLAEKMRLAALKNEPLI